MNRGNVGGAKKRPRRRKKGGAPRWGRVERMEGAAWKGGEGEVKRRRGIGAEQRGEVKGERRKMDASYSDDNSSKRRENIIEKKQIPTLGNLYFSEKEK